MKEFVYDAANYHYDKAEEYGTRAGEQEQVMLAKSARSMMQGNLVETNLAMANSHDSEPPLRIAAMRNLVNHEGSDPSFRAEWFVKYRALQTKLDAVTINPECPICMEGLEEGNLHLTMCNHACHSTCFTRIVQHAGAAGAQCPLCKRQISRPLSETGMPNTALPSSQPRATSPGPLSVRSSKCRMMCTIS